MSAENDEIVISGVGGYFPKAENLEKLKEALFANEILLGSRWKEGDRGVTNKIGVIPNMECFDAAFFGIHRQQATFMDPMQRLMMERSFEALIDAGVNPQDVRGRRIGVFMGSSIGENDNVFYESIVSGFGVTGQSRAMLPNRISYWLNLKGPSCAYDSNWTNGIEVLQLAYDAIKEGHCEAAIIGCVNLALNPEISYHYNDMGLLSPDGSTKSFDAEATGYARSDGAVAMFIQRSAEAKRSYASVVKVASQFNGYREGTFMEIDQPSLAAFIHGFYETCDVKPEQVDYMECYGCAVKKTDEIELNAIDETFGKQRKRPLMIGSMKPNTGHSEAAANLFDIAKIIISMESEKIPATLQYSKPNPDITGLVEGRLEVVTENRDFDIQYAAVNGIGLSSVYAHCLLKSNRKKKNKQESSDDLPRLVVTSSRTEDGIKETLETIKKSTFDPEYLNLIQSVYSKSIPGHLYRGYSILDKSGEISHELEHFPGNKRPIWFVFSGMGSQWVEMGKALMQLPIFAETIMKCHKSLEPHGVDLLKIITINDPHIFDNILHSFVGIAAVQIALTDILRALGVVPDGIIGHSVGELGCAYADNCLTAEQMIMCAYSRGKASLDAELIRGMMAAVGLGYNQIKNQVPESIEVACHNGPNSSTISGPTADMEVFVKKLQDRGIFARLVNVSNIAYHSKYIKPAAPYLLKYLQEVIPEPVKRSSKWVSTSVPEGNWESPLAKTSSAEYHTNNLLNSVLFEEGSKHIPKDSVVIEIAPHGLLQAILKKSLKTGCTNIPLTQRGAKNPINYLLGAIGKMHLAGLDVNVANIFPQIEYPVSRGTSGLVPLVNWEHSDVWRTGLEDQMHNLNSVKDLDIDLNNDVFKYLVNHKLDNRAVYNLSSYLSAIIKILNVSKSIEITEVVFENIRFRDIIEVPKLGSVPFFGSVHRGSGDFEIISGPTIIATGRILVPQTGDEFFMHAYEIEHKDCLIEVFADDLYTEFLHRGHNYEGDFKKIKQINFYEEGSKAILEGGQSWEGYLECLLQQNLFVAGEKYQDIRVPIVIQKIIIAMEEIPLGNEDVISTFDYSTGILDMKGLQMCRITSSKLPLQQKPISYDSCEFISFENCYCENIEKVLNYCINLTMINFSVNTNDLIVTEIASNRPSLLENIKNVTKKYTKIQSYVSSVTDAKINITTRMDAVLFVHDDVINEVLVNSIIQSEAFCLVRTNKNILSFSKIEALATFVVNDVHYSLIHAASNNQVKVIKAEGTTLTAADIVNQSQNWCAKLKTSLLDQRPDEDIYLLSKYLPTEGLYNFTNELRSTSEFKELKYIFVLDQRIGDMNLDSDITLKVFAKNNTMTVYKNGTFGTYIPASVEFNENINNDKELSSVYFKASHPSGNLLGGCSLSCIGINSNNESLHTSLIGLGNIDYSAVSKEQERVMGLAQFDPDTHNLILDPILKWKVPEAWSMEDACSVPHAYMTAYYCLIQKGKLTSGMTVLIDAGCSAIGLAAISVATSLGCTVFTTVATDWQKSFLKKSFSALKEANILSSETAGFEPELLNATNGAGAHVILSCQTDSLMHASIRCLGEAGKFVQLGKLDIRKNNTIGMSVFLKNTSVTGAIPENIFSASEEDKLELQKLVQDGISGLVVRPLHRKVVEHQDIASILTNLKQSGHIGKIVIKLTKSLSVNQLNIDKHNQFVCDGGSSYLIYGGTSELWIDMAEWLVFRGARKITISSDSRPMQRHVNRRISLLQSQFKAEIIYVSNKAQKKDGAIELVSELYSHGPIHGVYILPDESGVATTSYIKPVQYIETAIRTTAPKALFVNFLASIGGICQSRGDAGFPTYNVQWDDGLEFVDVLYGLDDVLSFRASHVIIKNDRISDLHRDTWQTVYKRLLLLLPSSPDELIQQTVNAPREPELVQLPSLGSRHIREVPPVIIVPGLISHCTIQEFVKELVYPIFYTARSNLHMPIKEAASVFAKKIRDLFPKGPYNIVGTSSGGILSIEISKILQNYANTQVTLIDGAPDAIQESLKYLDDSNLLARILNINSIEFTKQLSTLPDWDSRVNAALERHGTAEDDKIILKEAITLLKKDLQDMSEYQSAKGELLNGPVHFIRPHGSSKLDYCGLDKYFKQTPQLRVLDGDHLSVLKSKATMDYINLKITVV